MLLGVGGGGWAGLLGGGGRKAGRRLTGLKRLDVEEKKKHVAKLIIMCMGDKGHKRNELMWIVKQSCYGNYTDTVRYDHWSGKEGQ